MVDEKFTKSTLMLLPFTHRYIVSSCLISHTITLGSLELERAWYHECSGSLWYQVIRCIQTTAGSECTTGSLIYTYILYIIMVHFAVHHSSFLGHKTWAFTAPLASSDMNIRKVDFTHPQRISPFSSNFLKLFSKSISHQHFCFHTLAL